MRKKPGNGPGAPPAAPTATATATTPSNSQTRPWTSGRLALRCTLPYAEWAHGLAGWARIPLAEVVDQAVRRYADQLGFPPEQPARLPSARAFLPSYQLSADFRRSGGGS